jgi:hypothetical protein
VLTASKALAASLLLSAFVSACDDGADEATILGDPSYERDPALDVPLISAHGEALSHNMGQNCMACHQAHGPGPGRFTAAGTLYGADGTPHADGSIELRTGSSGTGELVLRIAADSNGNFYTTEALPLPDQPLFPAVYDRDDKLRNAMPFPTSSAACNVCHVGAAVIVVP